MVIYQAERSSSGRAQSARARERSSLAPFELWIVISFTITDHTITHNEGMIKEIELFDVSADKLTIRTLDNTIRCHKRIVNN